MKYMFIVLLFATTAVNAQKIQLEKGLFKTGDDASWAQPGFNDAGWQTIDLTKNWEPQGNEGYNGFAWYRIHFTLSSSMKVTAVLKDDLEFMLAKIDDADITYLNGKEIGHSGSIPGSKEGYVTAWNAVRKYRVNANDPILLWDKENVLAIRVYDGDGAGGMFGMKPVIHFLQPADYVTMDASAAFAINDKSVKKSIVFKNTYTKPVSGTLQISVEKDGKTLQQQKQNILLPSNAEINISPAVTKNDGAVVQYVFTESLSKEQLTASFELPYILTPKEKETPQINNPLLIGNRTGAPFLLRIAATGLRPMKFAVQNLPAGLTFNAATGIISGAIAKDGAYEVTLQAENKKGKALKKITIEAGNEKIQLTPPMGWNSWNCWGLSVSDAKVRSSANAMVNSGLINHGFTYMNIDDGWEAAARAADGAIVTNDKFPDMKVLSAYLHSNGLKLGIYSSPGPLTCGGYLGSYQHVQQDANTYANWGIDYLKYDWCSYGEIAPKPSLEQLQQPYIEMHKALRNTNRNIVFSLCQYGMGNVWEWGNKVGGNLWRTTGDIEDTWESLKNIAFRQDVPSAYNGSSYGFGDPDMLTVGMVGWGEHLHQTRLTPSEQYTEISLWSLLSAPLILGCDLSKIDPFTYNLLSNDEVLAIDQDIAGRGAKKVVINEQLQVWIKELANGNKAVGIFNLGDKSMTQSFQLQQAGLNGSYSIRDAWRQKDLATGNTVDLNIPAHGVTLLVLK